MISQDVRNKGVILEFKTHGNDKQKEVAKLWADNTTRDIVYGGSKGCFAPSTKVKTDQGFKNIEDIQVSDNVVTMNESTGKFEINKVLSLKKFHVQHSDEYHKIITFVFNGGNIISMTTNHELFISGFWVAAGELARRVLGESSAVEWKVSDFDQGASSELWTDRARFFKRHYLPKIQAGRNREKRKEIIDRSSSISCYRFHSKSRKQTLCESSGFRYDEQRQGQFGVVDSKGEYLPFQRQESSVVRQEQAWCQLETNIIEGTGFGNKIQVQAKENNQRHAGETVRSVPSHDKGYCFAQELEIDLIEEIRFDLIQGYVYDLHVENNHNYCVSEESIIVHNSGKSFLGASLIMGDAFTFPGTQYTIARKTLSDLRKYTMNSIDEVVDKTWKIPQSQYRYNHKDNAYYLKNGSTVFLTDAKYLPSDPLYSRFGGWQLTKAWVEESGEFEGSAVRNILASVGRWKNNDFGVTLKGKILQTCNPAKNYLYTDYYKPFKDGNLDPWKAFVQALPTDNHKLQEGYLAGLYESLDYASRKRLLEGDWEYDDDPATLIEYDKLPELFTRPKIRTGNKYVTADIASMGGDRIVIISWEGFHGTVQSFKRKTLPNVTKAIEGARIQLPCPKENVIVDADGMGVGVEQWGGFRGFRNNSRALPDPKNPRDEKGRLVAENFDMLKSQVGFRTAARIMDDGMSLSATKEDQELIIQELEQLKQKSVGTDMKKGLVPKDDIKKLINRSPDFMDAIIMREWFELIARNAKIKYYTGNERKFLDSSRDPYYYPEVLNYGN